MTPSTALRVRLDGRDAVHYPALASLPGRFLVVDGGPAEVVVVSGRSPRWPGDVERAVRDGARGVLLTRPGLVDAARVRALASAVAGAAVVAVDTPYANDRTWTAARREIATDAVHASVVDSVVSIVDDDPATALVDQLAAVADLLEVRNLRLVHRTAAGYLATAETEGPWLTLTGVTAGVADQGLSIDVVGAERRWQVRFDGTAPAVPAVVTRHDRSGAHSRPLIHESGHRAAWERLHEAITGAGSVGWSLDDLAGTLALAGPVLGHRKEYAGE